MEFNKKFNFKRKNNLKNKKNLHDEVTRLGVKNKVKTNQEKRLAQKRNNSLSRD